MKRIKHIVGLTILLGLGTCLNISANENPKSSIVNTSTKKDELSEANRLEKQVLKLFKNQKYTEATPLQERVILIRRKWLAPKNSQLASSFKMLAFLYHVQGRYVEAESLFKKAIEIYRIKSKKSLAHQLANFADHYRQRGLYKKATLLYLEAINIYRKSLPDSSIKLAEQINKLGLLYHLQGKYIESMTLHKEALDIYQSSLPSDHLSIALTLGYLGELNSKKGTYPEAESYLKKALLIEQKKSPKYHPSIGITLNNLAGVYRKQGRFTLSKEKYIDSLGILRKSLPHDHPDIAATLNNLAELSLSQRKYSSAKKHLSESVTILKNYSKYHPSSSWELIGTVLNNLALANIYLGHYGEAKPLLNQALKIDRVRYPGNHPQIAVTLSNLGSVNKYLRHYSEALTHYEDALSIRRQSLPSDHLSIAIGLNLIAALHWSQNRSDLVLKFLSEGLIIEEKNLVRNLSFGSEQQKRSYSNLFLGSTDLGISSHLQLNSTNPQAAKLALSTILRRKGRILDVLGQSFQQLRSNSAPQIRAKLAQLQAIYKQLSALFTDGSGPKRSKFLETYQALTDEAQKLTTELSNASSELAEVFQTIDISSVQAAIPRNAVLIEFIIYHPFYPKARPVEQFGPPHYAAYTLTSKGALRWVDLGPAKELDPLIRAFRRAVRDPSLTDSEVKRPAQALDTRLMKPVRQLVGNAQHLLIAPDGPLNLIPFEALIDEQDRFLLETHQITYLTSGRDLLRLQNPTPSAKAPLLLAAPNYDRPGISTIVAQSRSPNNRASDLANLKVAPLPGTLTEGKAIAQTFPNLKLITGAQATEAIIKQTSNPSILHIATHGFFLKDKPIPIQNQPLALATTNQPLTVRIENPLLRSGLAMAGFNLRQSGQDDGVLTALEVSGLDLRATQMVVMSACDTGVGEVSNGEGVYGLRRAFTLAGAKSQLMSLWKVGDQSTKDLMVAFYERLKQGQGRGQALREAQLSMLKGAIKNTSGSSYRHPYYWAAFIRAGDWRPLDTP